MFTNSLLERNHSEGRESDDSEGRFSELLNGADNETNLPSNKPTFSVSNQHCGTCHSQPQSPRIQRPNTINRSDQKEPNFQRQFKLQHIQSLVIDEPDIPSSKSSDESVGNKSFESFKPIIIKSNSAQKSTQLPRTLMRLSQHSEDMKEEEVKMVTQTELFKLINSYQGVFRVGGQQYRVKPSNEMVVIMNLEDMHQRVVKLNQDNSSLYVNQEQEQIAQQVTLVQSNQLSLSPQEKKTEQQSIITVSPLQDPLLLEDLKFKTDIDTQVNHSKAQKSKKKKTKMKIHVSVEMVESQPIKTQKTPPKINIENEEEIDLEQISKMEKEFELKNKKQPLKQPVKQQQKSQDSLDQESYAFRVFQAQDILKPVQNNDFKKTQTIRVKFEDTNPQKSKEQFNELYSEYKKIQDQLQCIKTFKSAKLHIGFLFASPFCQISNSGGEKNHYLIFPQLQFRTEQQYIKSAAKNAGVIYKCAVATQTNFVQILSKAPKVLHISCHGIPNNKNTMKENYDAIKQEGDFLLFEHEELIGELVSEKNLKNLITNVRETELVFLAACESEFAARIFLKKGVKHVICIEQDKEVLDKAVLTFTNTFYRSIFDGESICEAFRIAKRLTSNIHQEREAQIFKLLLHDEISSKHQCLPIQFNQEKQFKDISDKILLKEIPAKIENLYFREKEMSKLIQKVNENQRLVFVFGLFGIGKSWIARNLLHFMKERKYFCGGIIFLSLKGTKTVETLCHQLYQPIVKNLIVNESNQAFLQELLDSKTGTIDFIIDFFNHNTQYTLKRVEKYKPVNLFKNEKSKKFLICLDNAEDLVEANGEEFNKLLKKLINQCPQLQIIITSRKHLFKIDDSIDPDPIFIPELKGTKPVELFLLKAQKHRQVSVEEIIDIIKMDSKFDIAAFTRNQVTDFEDPQFKSKLQQLLRQPDKVIEALKRHELFLQFAGNPLSITKLAACYANPHAKQRDLKSLYQLILQGKLEMNQLEEMDDNLQGGPPRRKTVQSNTNSSVLSSNQISLQLSINSSIQLLSQQSPEAEGLLYFLGLLPIGVKLDQLKNMWNEQVERQIEILKIYDFLEIGFGENYVVTPFLIDFLQETIQLNDKETFIQKICSYYCGLLKRLYSIISLENEQDQQFMSSKEQDIQRSESVKEHTKKQLSYIEQSSKRISKILTHSTTLPFTECLISQMQASTKDNSVLEESLMQVVNIEHVIEMLITREKEINPEKSPKNSWKTDSDSDYKEDINIQQDQGNKTTQSSSFLRQSTSTNKVFALQQSKTTLVRDVKFSLLPRKSSLKFKGPSFLSVDDALATISENNAALEVCSTEKKQWVQFDRIEEYEEDSFNISQSSISSKRRYSQFKTPIKPKNAIEEVSETSSSISDQSQVIGNSEKFDIQDLDEELCKEEETKNHHNKRVSKSQFRTSQSLRSSNMTVSQGFELYEKQIINRTQTIHKPIEDKINKIENSNVLDIQKKRKLKLMTTKSNESSITLNSVFDPKNEVSETEAFILYAIASMYLSNSFQFSLRICEAEFKNNMQSKIYKANILRFKALNLEQGAIKSDQAEKELSNLIDAVEYTKSAFSLFKENDMNQRQCIHGMALSLFQLGHLFQCYSSEMSTYMDLQILASQTKSKINIRTQSSESKQAKCNQKQCMDLAFEYYMKASKLFQKINHIKGQLITVQQQLKILTQKGNSQSDSKDVHQNTKTRLQIKEGQLKQKYRQYKETSNPFILRKQGEVISLLAELVMNSSNVKFFKEKQRISDADLMLKKSFTLKKLSQELVVDQKDVDSSDLSVEEINSEQDA